MKITPWVLLALACIVPLRADILTNSHFVDGPAHWQGDAETITTPGSLADPTSAPPGVVINLKPDKWTKIYQTFTAPVNDLQYTLTLKLSPDYSADVLTGKDPSRPALPPGLTDLPGYPAVNLDTINGDSTIVVLVTGPDSGMTYPIHLDLTKSGSQTFSGPFYGIDFSEGKTSIVVAFPPGRGSVILTTVSLK